MFSISREYGRRRLIRHGSPAGEYDYSSGSGPQHLLMTSEERFVNGTSSVRPDFSRNLWRTRQRRWISKRKLKRQLLECEARLQETRKALNTPKYLFAQMAQHCTLSMAGGRFFLRTSDMDGDTYGFTEEPLQYATTFPTNYFVDYLFDNLFPVERPNAAFTFNVYGNQSQKSFEGPLISVLLSSHQLVLENDNSNLVIYELTQSQEQAATTPLSHFFRGMDPASNASVMFGQCSIFIDSATDNALDGYYASLTSPEQMAKDLETTATIVENGAAGTQANSQVSTQSDVVLRKFDRIWKVRGRDGTLKGGVESKDYLKGAADTLRSTAKLVRECTSSKSCDAATITSGVSDILLSVSPVVGAAFPPVGIGISIVATIGLLFTSFAYNPSSLEQSVYPSDIKNAVDQEFVTFYSGYDTDITNSFNDFLQIDLNDYVKKAGSLAYILKTNATDAQALVDKHVSLLKSVNCTP